MSRIVDSNTTLLKSTQITESSIQILYGKLLPLTGA